ncbi:MAG: L-serine ammonia-lyase [Nocardioidaceae bacterium]
MTISVFDLFSIGIGPSSSHTVGPMRASLRFVESLVRDGDLPRVSRVEVQLFGSLGATGHGHGSDKAVLLGLQGEDPETVDTLTTSARVDRVRRTGRLSLGGRREIEWRDDDLVMHRRRSLPFHPNGMTFTAYVSTGAEVAARTYYSVGGGFVVDDEAAGADRIVPDTTPVEMPFRSGDELIAQAESRGLSISAVMEANERAWRTDEQIRSGLLRIWQVMQQCVTAGCSTTGVLPGGLKVPRRAPGLAAALSATEGTDTDPMRGMDWVNLYALAVNEENAAGGRVVTAPTNGAAGIIPAVLHYLTRWTTHCSEADVVRFLLAAGAIGLVYKENASISGAEVGCQGEVGSACSMAAGGLADVLGGTPRQVENAAEIAMEHNLGLTCDPVGGLVQIPCIERNAIASVKAINAARMAMRGDGRHVVSLDKVIKTMRETGRDMKVKYKETARGGLAVNVIEC